MYKLAPPLTVINSKMTNTQENKLCEAETCKKMKPLSEFYKNRSKPDGYSNWCKICQCKYHKEWSIRKAGTEAITRTIYMRERRHKDLNFKLRCNLRSRLHIALRNNQKSGKTIHMLGCTVEEFKIHLQTRFDENMSWQNYGSYWEIDHIKPCALFDMSDEKQQKECFHYSNMQPMEITKNRKKNDSYVE